MPWLPSIEDEIKVIMKSQNRKFVLSLQAGQLTDASSTNLQYMFISNQTKPGADQSAFSQSEGGMGTIQSISTPNGTMKLICLPASSSGAASGQGVPQLISVRSNGNTLPKCTAQTAAENNRTGRK